MAVSLLASLPNGTQILTALSTDTLPTGDISGTPIIPGAECYLIDIPGAVFEFNSVSWKQNRANGAAYSRPTIGGTVFASGTLTDGNDVIVPLAGAPLPCTLAITPAAGDTVSYWYTVDGTNYVLRAAVTTYTEERLDSGAVALKITRTAGSGTTSTWSIT